MANQNASPNPNSLSRSHCIVVARTCCAKSDVLRGNFENGGHHEEEYRVFRGCILPKAYSQEPSTTPARPFSWNRKFSSHAGAKSSDGENENDLEGGFSDLEIPPEDKGDEEAALGDVSKEESSDEDADRSLGISDVEADSSGGKQAGRRSINSPISKVLVETPRQYIISALDKWVNEGKPLGRSEISLAMLNLRKRRFYGKALQFFEWLEANKRMDFSERDYASYLDLIAKVHGIERAEKYINNIPESFRGEVIYRTLMANYVAIRNGNKTEEVFNKIRDLGFPITTFACNQLLLLYKRTDRKKITDILTMMEKENVKPSLFTYWLLIDLKGRSDDISGMGELVEMMKAEGMKPNLGIQAMMAGHYIFGNLNEKAESTLKLIEGDDIKENRVACKELLPLYAALGKEDDVERIWKVCEANPCLEECSAAIEAWGKLGKIENAEKVFEKMVKTWKTMSARYYNSMLKVYANHKLLSKGEDLTKRMSDSGCRIGPLTWDALVKLYVEAGEVEKADSILQKAVQHNQSRPLYQSYMAILDKYAKRGDVHNAEKIFHTLKQNGYVARLRPYQSLLQTYINAKVPAYGFRDRMKADNMFPNKEVAAQLEAVNFFKKTQISELLD